MFSKSWASGFSPRDLSRLSFEAGVAIRVVRESSECSGDTVKAVARRAGFGSAAAFSRAYSRTYGSAPAAARSSAVPVDVMRGGHHAARQARGLLLDG
ncbi:helix-turn-helix domain-containing protein [Variovorax sp. CF079]|uniref:helix-turn-helix domain-containing protein n=1 Tax=Variovorax sp. CF079 TaxID=1882774 RepID=UPI000B82E393|nr:helix-turn-helix domain-containing protein [Variovorax sp. CF079]